MPRRAAAGRIRAGVALVNAVVDGAGDEEVTPSEIARSIRDCLADSRLNGSGRVRKYLLEALDAVNDGMPADHVAMLLYAALGVLTEP